MGFLKRVNGVCIGEGVKLNVAKNEGVEEGEEERAAAVKTICN